MSILDRLFSRNKQIRNTEGSWRGPFFGMGELGNWHGIDPHGDGWQRNLNIDAATARHIPTVYACVTRTAELVSQCYVTHVKDTDKNPQHIRTSAAYRVLRNPNSYQSGAEFFYNLVATALFEGEAFAIATRNERSEINSLHLLPKGSCTPMVDPETKEIYYSIGESPLAPTGIDYMAPARDIYHLKFHTPRHPLIGESPIKAAALALGINVALSKNQAAFFEQMSRPSGILSTDMSLNAQQMQQLRAAFEEQAKSWKAGGMPILGNGIKFQQLGVSSQDAQVVQAQRMSTEEICRVFGVPPPLVGDLSHATLNNTETLISHFLSTSLGSKLEIIERGLDRLFGLGPNEYIELDTQALLRTNFQERIDGLTKAVQGGLMSIDEARLKEGLPPVAGGSDVFLQRQMTSVQLLSALQNAELANANKPEPSPVVQPPMEEGKSADPDVSKSLVVSMFDYKRKGA